MNRKSTGRRQTRRDVINRKSELLFSDDFHAAMHAVDRLAVAQDDHDGFGPDLVELAAIGVGAPVGEVRR